nr:hypothetical protein [Tanacetum cinerariifolium]
RGVTADLPAFNEHDLSNPAKNLRLAGSQDNVIIEPISDVQPSPTIISPIAAVEINSSPEVILQTPVPQDKWLKEKHIELVNIIGEPLASITTRSRAKDFDVAS